MTRMISIFMAASLLLAAPTWVGAAGFEAAVGIWHQTPSGDISYKGRSAQDELNLDRNLGLGSETNLLVRARLETPMVLPDISFMAAPSSFSGTGRIQRRFTFGDRDFVAEADLEGKVRLNQFDFSLFYGIPGLKAASSGIFNLDLGLNLRLIDFSAEVRQPQTGISASESYLLPIPTLYAGAGIRPFDVLAFEAEARGVTYSGNHFYSLIGRIRVDPIDHLFIAGGWRYDSLSIDEKELKADIDLSGPFAEIGFTF